MFNFTKAVVLQLPSGRWGYAGRIPESLCDVVPATKYDIMRGVAFRRDGEMARLKPWTFETEHEALLYGEEMNAI